MSTLPEIEQAIAALPVPLQRKLHQTLGDRLSHRPELSEEGKREAVEQFLQRWAGAGTEPISDEDLKKLRDDRLTEKYLK